MKFNFDGHDLSTRRFFDRDFMANDDFLGTLVIPLRDFVDPYTGRLYAAPFVYDSTMVMSGYLPFTLWVFVGTSARCLRSFAALTGGPKPRNARYAANTDAQFPTQERVVVVKKSMVWCGFTVLCCRVCLPCASRRWSTRYNLSGECHVGRVHFTRSFHPCAS